MRDRGWRRSVRVIFLDLVMAWQSFYVPVKPLSLSLSLSRVSLVELIWEYHVTMRFDDPWIPDT